MAEAELKSLIKKRSSLKGLLTRFKNNFEKVNRNNSADIRQLELRLSSIEGTLNDFNEVQDQIENFDPSEYTDSNESEREQFENNYYELKANALILIESINTSADSHSDSDSVAGSVHTVRSDPGSVPERNTPSIEHNQNSLSHIRLPTLELQTFSGEYDQWMSFYDTFNSLINNNDSLTHIQKFHYLRSTLKGDAAQIIQSLEVSSENYDVAWRLLKDRFENKTLIINNHVKALFELEPVHKESHSGLQQLLNNMQKHLRALNALQQPSSDTLIIFLVASKFDPMTKREWEKIRSELNTLPMVEELINFLTKKCHLLESLYTNKRHHEKSNSRTACIALQKSSCRYCKGEHPIYLCRKFLNLSISDRINEITKLKICKNCFRDNHATKNCKSSSSCQKCQQRHNTLLHLVNEQSTHSANSSAVTENPVGLSCSYVSTAGVLLPTAIIYIYDHEGVETQCRVLLDSASQSNFITQGLFDKLKLKGKRVNFPISGINNAQTHVVFETKLKIKSCQNSFGCVISCLVLPEITQRLPQTSFSLYDINIPENIQLADPTFNKTGEIHCLLGCELFWQILCLGQISLGKNLPVAQKTHFGWVISGRLHRPQSYSIHHAKSCCVTATNEGNENKEIQEQLSLFWKLEEIDSTKDDYRETDCERFFLNTTSRNEEGRFIVRLPFKYNCQLIGESYSTALRRFLTLEKRLDSNSELKSLYSSFMQEYQDLGHMTQVNYTDAEREIAYFLPHHAVLKPDSTTSKIRVVFDGSCKGSFGVSLNDTLMVGPTIQPELISILVRFRTHRYVFTSDCEKMYRQVLVHKNDRIKQNILWRNDSAEPIKYYQLNTVTYGTASASFLATRCLLQIAIDNETTYPEASARIKSDFYVDDLISGCNFIENAIVLINQINELLISAGFPLRKWASNDPSILQNLPHTTNTVKFHDSSAVKTLGLMWNSESDTFHYPTVLSSTAITKRTILSTISKIFDPLGLVGPVIIKAKIMIQKLWSLQLEWDESVPMNIFTSWSTFQEDLKHLNDIAIPRHILCVQPSNIQLHGFADASESSYGGCIYVRSTDPNGSSRVHLLCAKSKVAPLKSVSLPRLELCAAHLLARLMNKTISYLDLKIDTFHYWSDSTIVIAWINKPPNQLKTFVANRVSSIISVSKPIQWHHVRSQDNPADIISRGTNPQTLAQSSLWWHGPDWLSSDPSSWPTETLNSNHLDIPDVKPVTVLTTTNNFINDFIIKYSDIIKLQRTLTYCFRFIKNSSRPSLSRVTGYLSVSELKETMNKIIRAVQLVEFSEDISKLKTHKSLSNSSKLLALHPFLDKDDVLRVGGRLTHSNLDYNRKFPVILPSNHHLTILLIRHIHLKYFHAGTQAVISALRQEYWPISITNTVKKVLRECVTCKRITHRSVEPFMGDLPRSRIQPSRPFFTCGTDFAGPFLVREFSGRGRKTIKAYLCIFVCFATKAVHLEVVSSLSTEAFIACLKRFIARRGLCGIIHSDNGSNYVGANKELKNWFDLASSDNHNEAVSKFLSGHSITWKFIPARSPHFGGIWEAAVKSAKRHLYKYVGSQNSFTFEELVTLFSQIEAVLNSRPLIPLTSNPDDYNFLSPAHFLIGDSLMALPEPNLLDSNVNRLKRFHLLQHIHQQFWKKWSSDYLTVLQRRTKWLQPSRQLRLGTLVLLRDNTPPLMWRMGRIIEVHPGPDGVIRVVSVKTSTGIVQRSATQVCELLNDNPENVSCDQQD